MNLHTCTHPTYNTCTPRTMPHNIKHSTNTDHQTHTIHHTKHTPYQTHTTLNTPHTTLNTPHTTLHTAHITYSPNTPHSPNSPHYTTHHTPDLFSKQIENRRFNVNSRMQQYNIFFATMF